MQLHYRNWYLGFHCLKMQCAHLRRQELVPPLPTGKSHTTEVRLLELVWTGQPRVTLRSSKVKCGLECDLGVLTARVPAGSYRTWDLSKGISMPTGRAVR